MAAAPLLRYDELTWPQVADLPRHARLLVPVVPMAADEVRQSLPVDESPIVLLPAIPYGSAGLNPHAPIRPGCGCEAVPSRSVGNSAEPSGPGLRPHSVLGAAERG